MHNGDTFALDVVRERYYLRPGTDNMGSPEFTELLELCKDRVYDANIASAAKNTARHGFGGAIRRNDPYRRRRHQRRKLQNHAPMARGGGTTSHLIRKGCHQGSSAGKAKDVAPTVDRGE
eukprot:jgi/Tetstr1/427483/TSEL_017611.t1